jgi:tetratricopeptide (TPR) repeat protein
MKAEGHFTPPPGSPPPRGRPAFTLGLLAFLAVLAIVLGICWANPPWLERMASGGKQREFADAKNWGDDALRRGRPEAAISVYQHALSIDPGSAEVKVNLGIAWYQRGEVGKAMALLQEALGGGISELTRAHAHANLGEIMEKRGDAQAAIEHFTAALAGGVERDRYCLRIGNLHLKAERFAQAEAAFTAALADQMDAVKSYREMLRRSLDDLCDQPEHRAALEALLARDVDADALATRFDLTVIERSQLAARPVAVTHNLLGWTLIRQERFAEAAAHFQRSLEIWPNNANAEQNLATLRRMQAESRKG